ncbi:MAG: MoaD/ThiS family protein [Vicingaceae bacterium]|nr:MoaD/ThiS family protein [Vicingaceae bacterium]
MILKFKYFGMIAEALNKEAEELDVDFTNVAELISYYQTQLKDINFKVAVNHSLVDLNYQLKNNDEVALLPPFAGG